jgi:membrane protein
MKRVAIRRRRRPAPPREGEEAPEERPFDVRGAMRPVLSGVFEFLGLFRKAGESFARDNMPAMSAALAYNTLLSLAPLLFVLIGIFQLLAQVDVVENQIISQVGSSLGPKAVQAVRLLLDNMAMSRSGAIAIGGGTIVLLIVFSTGAFQQLIHALNVVWKVSEAGRRGFLGGILRLIRTHLLAFLMLVCVALYLYASVLLSAIKVVQEQRLIKAIPVLQRFIPRLPLLIAPAALFLLFMLVFRVLPARRIAWKDVWCGSLVTTALFWGTNRVLLFYLQRTAVSSFYGVAGSFVIVLLWVYWSTMIVLYGAEFAKAYADRYGTLRRR